MELFYTAECIIRMSDGDDSIARIDGGDDLLYCWFVFFWAFSQRDDFGISSLTLESFSYEIFLIDSGCDMFESSQILPVSQEEFSKVSVVESFFSSIWKTDTHSIP